MKIPFFLFIACLSPVAWIDAADAHLELPAEKQARSAANVLHPESQQNVTVYQEPGRYGGWPANHGLWQWDNELVAGFTSTWFKHQDHDHAIDRTKPSYEWQARSVDGGQTWKVENDLPFADPAKEAKPGPLQEPLDFTAPDFALMFRFGSLHVGPSWYYVSNDRCKNWRGPFTLKVEGIDKICTRTDLIVLGPRDCLMFGSAGKADAKEGRIFCARTTDGGLTWKLVARIGEEPEGYAIMPSSLRLKSGAIITTVRRYDKGKPGFIEAWRSEDLGEHWTSLGKAAPDIGGGNPPALVQLHDGRLALSYGYRAKPYGMRARISTDEGRSWSDEIVLRDDGLTGDLGYPRSVVRPDGKVLTVYYFNGPRDEDRTIQATFWTPPARTADVISNSIGMKLVSIPAGTFMMGQEGPPADYKMWAHPAKDDDADVDEKPVHRVTLSASFHLGMTEVTLGQYRQFKPGFGSKRNQDDEAATGVSWDDAMAFCQWLSAKEKRSYRLPTEAEWEYACRAGTTTVFDTGDHLPEGFQMWQFDDGRMERYFKGRKPPHEYRDWSPKAPLQVGRTVANAWGLLDMHGNAAEWCADWYGPYEAKDQTDPLGRNNGDFRVIRGGSYNGFVRLLRSANRSGWIPEARNSSVGFRVVMGDAPKGETLPSPPAPLNAQKVAARKFDPARNDTPYFAGPRPFVIIPPNSAGPLFSWHNHSPSIAECPNGDLLAVWYSTVDEGGSELTNLASRLPLGATEWQPASPFWDGPDVNDHAPKLWADGRGKLFHFARGSQENIMRISGDSGATWSKASIIQPVGEYGNGLLELKDGTLVLGNDARQVSLVFSHDHGRTWSYNEVDRKDNDYRPGGKGNRYPGIHAPMVQLNDGRIMAISRQDKPEDQAKFHFKTPVSYTSDLGKTWSYEESEFPAISSVQRQVLMRLREGPLLLCSFTDQRRDWDKRVGMDFKAADGHEFKGFGLFAALSFDDGKTWPFRKLITPGGPPRDVPSIDRNHFPISDTEAESCGYMAATQTRDGNVQLVSSKNHYVFNLAWLKELPKVKK